MSYPDIGDPLDAVALANDGLCPAPTLEGPRAISLHHIQTGVGTETIEHRVEIRDSRSGILLANFAPSWAALWLRQRGYTYVMGSRGLWLR
jgi:hypothetical protein